MKGGLIWNSIDIGSGVMGTCYFVWVPATPVVYILGSSGGIKRSTDNGLNWVTTPTPGVTGLSHFEFIQSGMIVYGYAVSSTGNVIKLTDTLDILTGTNPINNLPNGYSLSQNYPNPFNPQTMITYSIPQSSFVNITVFDILGRELYSPVNEIKKAGSYELNINAGQIGSGIYYYRMSAGDFSDTKKMIVIK